jgi:hypothetical protein
MPDRPDGSVIGEQTVDLVVTRMTAFGKHTGDMFGIRVRRGAFGRRSPIFEA